MNTCSSLHTSNARSRSMLNPEPPLSHRSTANGTSPFCMVKAVRTTKTSTFIRDHHYMVDGFDLPFLIICTRDKPNVCLGEESRPKGSSAQFWKSTKSPCIDLLWHTHRHASCVKMDQESTLSPAPRDFAQAKCNKRN